MSSAVRLKTMKWTRASPAARQRLPCPQESCTAQDTCISMAWWISIPREGFNAILYVTRFRFLFSFIKDKYIFCYFLPTLLWLMWWFPWVRTCYYEDYWSKLNCFLSSRVWFADIISYHYGWGFFTYWPLVAVLVYLISGTRNSFH